MGAPVHKFSASQWLSVGEGCGSQQVSKSSGCGAPKRRGEVEGEEREGGVGGRGGLRKLEGLWQRVARLSK